MAEVNDQYCLMIKRWGCFGMEEQAGRLSLHMVQRDEVERWVDTTLKTIGPGDRAELTITRGQQVPKVVE